MARKSIDYPIEDEGRDRGKVFRITEMPALKAEKWAIRVFLALCRAGADIPDNIQSLGMAGIAMVGLRGLAGVKFEEAEPLLDEMMSCVQYVPDPKRPMIVRPLIEDDIEEAATVMVLRREIVELHTGFFSRAAILNRASDSAAMKVEQAMSDA